MSETFTPVFSFPNAGYVISFSVKSRAPEHDARLFRDSSFIMYSVYAQFKLHGCAKDAMTAFT